MRFFMVDTIIWIVQPEGAGDLCRAQFGLNSGFNFVEVLLAVHHIRNCLR
jgi:hypothetical protein